MHYTCEFILSKYSLQQVKKQMAFFFLPFGTNNHNHQMSSIYLSSFPYYKYTDVLDEKQLRSHDTDTSVRLNNNTKRLQDDTFYFTS
jgi:hypothetical protein